jgi:ABC-type transport system involved in multi-copper enzyme maturation permease subunit
MTTTLEAIPASPDGKHSAVPRPPDRLGMKGVIASEWTKLRSVRSTWWTVASTFGIMIGFGALLSWAYVSRFDRLDLSERLSFDPTAHALRGLFLAQLAIGVLGVLAITNEYATGMIRNTFGAVPQRSAVLAAKLAVFGAVALVVGEVASFVTFFAGQAILAQKNIGAGIGDPHVLRAVLGTGVYLAGIGIMGLGLGALLRRTAGAISALFALVLVLPILAEALPSPWNTDVIKLLPGGAGQAITAVRQTSDSLSAGPGLAVFLGYIALILVAAFLTIERRDA